jgi:hypothetical protein
MQPLSQEVPSTRTKNSRGVEPLHPDLTSVENAFNSTPGDALLLLALQRLPFTVLGGA